MIDVPLLRAALDEVRERMDDACQASGRPTGSAELVLAGKYVPVDEAPALLEAGVGVIGENRLQDLMAKQQAIGDAATFDFIGHLQNRKVKQVLPRVRLIHSVDRDSLIDEIGRRADDPARVLLQVNLAGEESKGGFAPDELDDAIERASRAGIVVGGLMALPPFAADPEASRPWFERLRALRDGLADRWAPDHDLRDLSMGTSQDFVVAVEAGATMVRVGRGIVDPTRMEQP
ncbi:MAG: YggS family pyridoxal phosphate-dependent enzyme [Actinobacteria bacterium]|nr:YggS family pyridoxal phosphate-dependent enzyme [Actinomycetota bacterium]